MRTYSMLSVAMLWYECGAVHSEAQVLEPWDAPLPYADYTTGLLVGSRRSGSEGSVNVGEGAGTGVPSGM